VKFSYSQVWEDAVALIRANAPLLGALAGAFFLLPNLLREYFLPFPTPTAPAEVMPMIGAYLTANFHWLLLASLVEMVGALAIFVLVLSPGGISVAAAIGRAARLLPFYFLAMLLWSLTMTAAALPGFLIGGLLVRPPAPPSALALLVFLLLLAVPLAYLFGRTVLLGPVVAAEGQRNPLAALRRSFALTRGRGWAVVAMVGLVFLAGFVLTQALVYALGSVLILAAGQDLGRLLVLIVAGMLSAALMAVLAMLYAALYRRLEAGGSAPAAD
jgi:hypothetical protein